MVHSYDFTNGKGETFRATLVIEDTRVMALELSKRAIANGRNKITALGGSVKLALEQVK